MAVFVFVKGDFMNNIDSATFHDANGEELNIGDSVIFLGQRGTVTFEYGAYGIGFKDGVNWYPIEDCIRTTTGNQPAFCKNDNFISFWEIIWNMDDDLDCDCLPGVLKDWDVEKYVVDNGKDIQMGGICSCCDQKLSECEKNCPSYYHCDNVALANELLKKYELTH